MTESRHAQRLAVLGSPIAHSRSPRIHSAAYRLLGLDWRYEAIELTEDDFDDFFAHLDEDWLGFSVTMPLKRKAFEFATVHDQAAEATGVANTLIRDAAGWRALNTDIGGIIASVRGLALVQQKRAVLFGAGATAVSSAFALAQMGFTEITVCARRKEQAIDLIERMRRIAPDAGTVFHFHHLTAALTGSGSAEFTNLLLDADIVVNTLPGQVSATLKLSDEIARTIPLFDLSYNPWPSPLCQLWEQNGGDFVDGLELLVRQAVLQIRTFVNGSPDAQLADEQTIVETMRRASVER